MLNANELEAVSMALDKPMRALELRIMEDIIRRIKINGEITRAADWQINRLYELGVAKDDIAQIIAQSLDLNSGDLQKMYSDVIEAGYSRDDELYKVLGIQRIAFDDNEELHQLLFAVSEQTLGELKNITQSLGFAVKQPNGKITFTEIGDFYQQTLDSAMLDIASGAFDYSTVLMRTVKQLTNSGLRSVDYATGWSNRVDVAARRAVVTGLSQLTAKVNDDNAKALGTNTFEVSWHSGARPSHQEWQGKWYTKEELISICGLGQVTGLCGANCYHDYYAVIPGISVPSYTQKELDELNAKENTPIEYNGKQYTTYEATQRQRALERTMRAQRQDIKLLEAGGANEDDIINARARYRGTSAEYVRFSKAMNLPQQRERVTIDGLGNIGVGKYKADLTLKDYDDILYMRGKMSDLDVRKWYNVHDKRIGELIDTTLSLENQARQAHEFRNTYKFQARELMADQDKRKMLDESRPLLDFDYYYKKYSKVYKNEEDVYKAIIDSSMRPNKEANRAVGLEE